MTDSDLRHGGQRAGGTVKRLDIDRAFLTALFGDLVTGGLTINVRGVRHEGPDRDRARQLFAASIHERGGRALVLVHRDELARQAVEKLALVVPPFDIGVVKGPVDECDARIIVGSPTERQLAALRRCRVHARPGLTRGEAADLLTATFAGLVR